MVKNVHFQEKKKYCRGREVKSVEVSGRMVAETIALR